jgi:D-alanine-D-alanine ligase
VDAHAFDPSQRDLGELKREGFERCFIALHGRLGEDGTVQGALELLGLPYTGSGVMASAIAMDKVMTKRLWRSHGLDTPASVCLSPTEQSAARIAAIPAELGLPLIVKPPREGSSIGVTKVCQASDMAAAAALATRYDPELLCEAFIDGDEITCPVLGEGAGAVALPIVRIAAPQGDYDYQNKYFTDTVKYHCPSGLPAAEEEAIQQQVLAAYRSLGCRGWGRADLMIRASDLNMQPVHDAVNSVVMQTTLANIDSVMVAGQWKKRHGQLLGADLAPQLAALRASGEKITRAMGL